MDESEDVTTNENRALLRKGGKQSLKKKDRIRVGINANPFTDPRIRGFNRYTLNLIKAIHSEYPDDFEFILYCNRDLAQEIIDEIPFVRIRVLPLRPYEFWEQIVLPILLALDSVDIYHSTTNFGVPLFRPFFTSTVLTLHDLFTVDEIFESPRTWFSGETLRFNVWHRFLWYTSRSADAIITVSHYTRQELLERYRGLPRITKVIYNGVEEEFHPGQVDPEILERFQIQCPYILYVGGFEARKNVTCLVDSYRSLRDSMKSETPAFPKLVMIGRLNTEDHYLHRILETDDDILCLGYLEDDIVQEFYRGAFFGVVPSKQEGFGLPAAEFMASGIPVIVAEATALPEVVGHAAPVFDPDNCHELTEIMQRMIMDEAWHSQWKEKVLEQAKKFSWKTAANETAKLYRDLVSVGE